MLAAVPPVQKDPTGHTSIEPVTGEQADPGGVDKQARGMLEALTVLEELGVGEAVLLWEPAGRVGLGVTEALLLWEAELLAATLGVREALLLLLWDTVLLGV